MMKFESKSKKRRIREILRVLRGDQPFERCEFEKLDAWCSLYDMPCNYPEHTPHLSCRNCGGKLAIVKRKTRT